MKKLLYILLLLLPVSAMSQVIYKNIGNTNETVRAQGGLQVDSNAQLPLRDTNYIPIRAGAFVFFGSQAYVYNGVRWMRLSTDTLVAGVQVNSDWNASSGVAQILNKPTLATVATSGNYNDLTSKPTIPAAQVNSDWNALSGISQILNKPSLATVATSGSYTDLINKPTFVDTLYAISASSFNYDIGGRSHTISITASGAVVSNIGAFYRLVVAGSNIRTIADGTYIIVDSSSNAQALTFSVDTTHVAYKTWVTNYVTSQGFITGNQTITLSGPVVGSGTTTINDSLANASITYQKIQNETSGTLLGRFIGGSGPPGQITIGVGLTTSGSTLIADSTYLATQTYVNNQGFFNIATNGVSSIGPNIVLGQAVGAGGNPGKLLSPREIPFNGQSIQLTANNEIVIIDQYGNINWTTSSSANYSKHNLSIKDSTSTENFYVQGYLGQVYASTGFNAGTTGVYSNGSMKLTSQSGTGQNFVNILHNLQSDTALAIRSNDDVVLQSKFGNVLIGGAPTNPNAVEAIQGSGRGLIIPQIPSTSFSKFGTITAINITAGGTGYTSGNISVNVSGTGLITNPTIIGGAVNSIAVVRGGFGMGGSTLSITGGTGATGTLTINTTLPKGLVVQDTTQVRIAEYSGSKWNYYVREGPSGVNTDSLPFRPVLTNLSTVALDTVLNQLVRIAPTAGGGGGSDSAVVNGFGIKKTVVGTTITLALDTTLHDSVEVQNVGAAITRIAWTTGGDTLKVGGLTNSASIQWAKLTDSSEQASLVNTGVAPGSYTNLNATIGADGRITAASNGSGGSGSFAYNPAVFPPSTANYTITTANFVILPDLTGQANRNVVLPSGPTSGQILTVKTVNTFASTFNWTFTGGTVLNYLNTAVTTLDNMTVYQLIFDGTNWDIIN